MAANQAAVEEFPVANQGGAFIEPLLTRPEKVAIVALGASSHDFVREVISRQTNMKSHMFDEVWSVNRGLRAFSHDKLFVMDDFRWIEKRSPEYAEWLKRHDRPIITSTAYPEYPNAVEYPLNQVSEAMAGDDIFTVNTISYMVAYAMAIGSVQELSIYGADFFYPQGNKAEEGGQAVAYLLGVATGRGMVIGEGMRHRIPSSSTLLYAHKVKVGPQGVYREPYGFHRKSELEKLARKDAPKQIPQEEHHALQTG